MENKEILTKREELDRFLDEAETPFSDTSIYYDHKEIYRHFSGCSNDEKTKKTDGSELYFLYSLTKVMTATAAMQLVERGIISLEDPVSNYLPEFESLSVKEEGGVRPIRNTLTVRHLLSMTGGFDYNRQTPEILDVLERRGSAATTREVISAIAKSPLCFEPGTHFKYSMCHDILASLIEEATGMRFGEYLNENILSPLGMKETYIGKIGSDVKERICTPYTYSGGNFLLSERKSSFILSDYYESGGAGIISSVSDYVLLVDALASGGVGKSGARILKEETVKLLTKPELTKEAYEDFKASFPNKPGYSYGLGVRVHTNKEESLGKSPIGEFGWSGAAGSYVLVDIENKLSVCYAEHVLGHPFSYDVVHPTVRDLAYGILEEYKEKNSQNAEKQ